MLCGNMFHPINIISVLSLFLTCDAVNVPNNAVFSSFNSFNNDESASKNFFLQTAATFPQQPLQNIDQPGSQFQSNQFNQQLPPNVFNQPSSNLLPSPNRYFVDFQHFDRNPSQAQTSIGQILSPTASNNQYQNSQAFGGQQLNQQQYQQQQQQQQPPLGVLFSAATDVSQFRFSGNGVNYSF